MSTNGATVNSYGHTAFSRLISQSKIVGMIKERKGVQLFPGSSYCVSLLFKKVWPSANLVLGGNPADALQLRALKGMEHSLLQASFLNLQSPYPKCIRLM